MKPNILILTLDAFRRDRTSLHGYSKPTTPNLERLVERAVVCENASALSSWTQPSLLTAFTSSRPFDCGGFDDGVKGRRSLFDELASWGYKTIGISTTPWVTGFFGYKFQIEERHFSLNALLGCYTAQMSSYLERWHCGKVDADETFKTLKPIMSRLSLAVSRFMRARGDRNYLASLVDQILHAHMRDFYNRGPDYLREHLANRPVPKSHEWLGAKWKWARSPLWLAREAAKRLSDSVVGLISPSAAILRRYRNKRFMDGSALASRIIAHAASADEPWCIWAHFHDTHYPYLAGAGPRWYRDSRYYIARTGGTARPENVFDEPGLARSELYDAAMLYTDEQIGRVVRAVGDRAIIAIAADHGEELGDHGDWGHHFRLYEHNVAVPMMFAGPGVRKTRVAGLTTLLDFAPTIAEMCGAKPDFMWRGLPVTHSDIAKRDHVILETVYGGTCDLRIRPPYVAVRTKDSKFLWKEHRDAKDRFVCRGDELYRLDSDPGEHTNWKNASPYGLPPKMYWYLDKIRDRLREVPEFSKDRLLDAFPAQEAAQ